MKYEITKKLSLKEKAKLKILSYEFLNLPENFNLQEGIIGYELKVVSNNFEAYKVDIAQFYFENNECRCKVVDGYAITDLNQNILYLSPSVDSKFIYNNKITEIELLDHIFTDQPIIGSFTKEELADYNNIKQYVDELTKDKGEERV